MISSAVKVFKSLCVYLRLQDLVFSLNNCLEVLKKWDNFQQDWLDLQAEGKPAFGRVVKRTLWTSQPFIFWRARKLIWNKYNSLLLLFKILTFGFWVWKLETCWFLQTCKTKFIKLDIPGSGLCVWCSHECCVCLFCLFNTLKEVGYHLFTDPGKPYAWP